ncbi:MAG: aminodeoxychorismate/anthranilate synthase component II, partial [Bacteroidales bacterium]|nr:aminodeoxychorismate/anthranilate synthase component II [Bacteroidales bacterium]
MKIAIIDNYDSFTYNLVHLVNSITGGQVQVYRNDMIGPGALDSFDGLILSPGPGIPDEAGQLKDIIRDYGTRVPVFGVCLGMQAIAEVYGGSLRNLPRVFHGVEKEILTTGTGHRIFRDIP